MIRRAEKRDLDWMLTLYAGARAFMARSGNPTQWEEDYPDRGLLEADLAAGQLYVVERAGRPCGAFVLALGEDPTYGHIDGGGWLRPGPYGTIHRLAGDGRHPGIFRECLAFCCAHAPDLRADTHADNRTMQRLLEQNGFVRCGTIYIWDGSPRIAYQLSRRPGEGPGAVEPPTER